MAELCIICLDDKFWPAVNFGQLAPSGGISEIKLPAKMSDLEHLRET